MPIASKQNFMREIIIDYTSITDIYTTIHNIGVEYEYKHIVIYNTTDTSIKCRFLKNETEIPAQESTVTTESDLAFTADDFKHLGVIQARYTNGAPTKGYIRLVSW